MVLEETMCSRPGFGLFELGLEFPVSGLFANVGLVGF
jgi:hypothetical protein